MRGIVLLTRGRRGIGRAAALTLAEAGSDVALTDLVEADEAQAIVGDIEATGRKARYYRRDLARTHDNDDDFLTAVEAELGAITCLVNNAGVQVAIRGDLLEVTEESSTGSQASTCTAPSSSLRRR